MVHCIHPDKWRVCQDSPDMLDLLDLFKDWKGSGAQLALKITDWSLFLPAVLLWLKSKKNVDAGSMENKNKTENAAEIRFLSCRGMWREKENVYDRGMDANKDSQMVVVSAKRGRRRFGNHSLTVWKRCKQKKNDSNRGKTTLELRVTNHCSYWRFEWNENAGNTQWVRHHLCVVGNRLKFTGPNSADKIGIADCAKFSIKAVPWPFVRTVLESKSRAQGGNESRTKVTTTQIQGYSWKLNRGVLQ